MPTQKFQVYKCCSCGNIVEVVHASGGTLVCCNQPMNLLDEQTADAANEKHVPVIDKTADGYKVTVGSTIHPMTDAHYIEWIELVVDDTCFREYLKPGNDPIVEFKVDAGQNVSAREYCTLHDLWRG